MATLTHTKSETVSALDNDLAASVPAPFPVFTRVQSSRGAPSILLSQPQQQGSTQQLVDVNVDVSQQPTLLIGVEAAETAQLASALVGGSTPRRCLGSFFRSVGGPCAFCYSCLSFERRTHWGNHQRNRESNVFLHIGLSSARHKEYSFWTAYCEALPPPFINLKHLVVHCCRRPRLSYQTRLHAFSNHLLGRWELQYLPVPDNEAMIDRSLPVSIAPPIYFINT